MPQALIKNKYGAVFAKGMWVLNRNSVVRVGFAFCNPKDFPSTKLSRKKWWERLVTIAEGRLHQERAFRLHVSHMGHGEFKDAVIAALFEMAAIDPDTLGESVPDEESCMPEAFGLRPFSGERHKCEFRRWMQAFIGMLSQQYRSR